jgi:hypothetical protein
VSSENSKARWEQKPSDYCNCTEFTLANLGADECVGDDRDPLLHDGVNACM